VSENTQESASRGLRSAARGDADFVAGVARTAQLKLSREAAKWQPKGGSSADQESGRSREVLVPLTVGPRRQRPEGASLVEPVEEVEERRLRGADAPK
jgi:hypothetical protein